MNHIQEILKENKHRPINLPDGTWKYYQEWHDTIFCHWKIPVKPLLEMLPPGLELDTLNGEAWITLVLFTVKKLRPKYIPAFIPVSNFDEVNLRTYVLHDNVPGIYFFSVEAQKAFSVLLAKMVTGIPYTHTSIKRDYHRYSVKNGPDGRRVFCNYIPVNIIRRKSAPDKWLTERYVLYLHENGNLYRYNVHHQPWPLKTMRIKKFRIHYRTGKLVLSGRPDRKHFAERVDVLVWGREKCK
jgi:uncharacterized protein YqjF (DUF2071 family)